MKYYSVIICLFFPLLTFSQPEKIITETTLNANFSGRHCRGTHGLCNFNSTNDKAHANTTIIYNKTTKNLVLKIHRNNITKAQETQIIGITSKDIKPNKTYYFIMEADFIIPEYVKTNLGMIDNQMYIKQGYYPITFHQNYFLITLKTE